MTAPRKHGWRWYWHLAWVSATLLFLALVSVVVFFGSGAGNPLLRRAIIHQIESRTGMRTELPSISIRWLSLRVSLHQLVVHGKEPAGTQPLFAAEEVRLKLRIDS